MRIPLAILLGLLLFAAPLARADEEVPSAATEEYEVDPDFYDPKLLSPEERVLGLVNLYGAAKTHFAWWEQVPDLDWEGVFLEFLPEVQKEQSVYDYYLTLKSFLALLNDGHTEVYFPDWVDAELEPLPFEMTLVEGKWVVTGVYDSKDLDDDPIPLGAQVLSVEGVETGEYLAENVLPYLEEATPYRRRMGNFSRFDLPRDRALEFKFENPDGSIRERPVPVGIDTVCTCTDEVLYEEERLDGGVHYILYGDCAEEVLDRFAETIRSFVEDPPTGVILDLRDNGGGSLLTSASATGYLIAEPVRTWSRWTRCQVSTLEDYYDGDESPFLPFSRSSLDHALGVTTPASEILPEDYRSGWLPLANPPEEFVQPRPEAYAGPLAILTNRNTASAAEDLTVLLRGNQRGPVIGELTAGTTGFQTFIDLPWGGRARICDVQHHYPGFGDYVGLGVIPDVPVLPTLRGVTEGRDEILEKALEFLSHPERFSNFPASPNQGGYFVEIIREMAFSE